MTLPTGTNLGPYEVLEPIGAGGMGEVYRARDSKLGRDVAVKVLPDAFARDTQRMVRFQREAKLLASLNHTNIAAIYGLEDSSGSRALVMELVEGPTLAQRIASGPIPVDEALPIARQICDALEYAHERGIIHRDLKPANIKVSRDDSVKVLDFGLAKAVQGEADDDLANSPTLSCMATQAGVLLGTAAYMSPEQAKAKPVDRRTDIWAFGCVLYEMLTGQRAFPGDTVTDTLAAIVRADPDWSLLPKGTPMRVRVLLQRCLQKDPKQRLRDIGDARISLDEVLSGAPDAGSGAGVEPVNLPFLARRPFLITAVAVVSSLALVALALVHFRGKRPVSPTMRFEIPLPEHFTFSGNFALSPNGRMLAFIGRSADGQSRLWVRPIDMLQARPLDSTEGADGWPIWSPDSRFIAFGGQGRLRKIEALGGPPLKICDAPGVLGGSWNLDDKIVFGSLRGLFQVAASGGSAVPLSTGGPSVFPFFLPDGRHFLYWRVSGEGENGLGIYLGSVDMKPQDPASKKILSDATMPLYAPSLNSATGYLLYVRGATAPGAAGTLMAQPFDPKRLSVTGEAVPIVDGISNLRFSTSTAGVLAFVTGPQSPAEGGSRGNILGRLTWFDRQGHVVEAVGDPAVYRTLALSPDGKQVAAERGDLQGAGNRDIWLYDFARAVGTRFTFDAGWDGTPVWSPDGSHIAFTSNRKGAFDLYQKASNLAGKDKLLYKSGDPKAPSSWSRDGRFLLYFNPVPPSHIWLLPLGEGTNHKAILLEDSKFNLAVPRFSPDVRWIAYSSDESGRDEIYVRPFDPSSAMGPSSARSAAAGKWMVSKDGGNNPIWRRDGKELFYIGLDGSAMTVSVSTSGVFTAGTPKALFTLPPGVLFWDVSPDGQKFLLAAPAGANAQSPFTVVLNWQSSLKKL
jgi:Tol biopolymer transport system component